MVRIEESLFFCRNVFGNGIFNTVLLTQQARRCQALSSRPSCVMQDATVINRSEIRVCSIRQYSSIQMLYPYQHCQPAKCVFFLFYINSKYNLALCIAVIGGKLVEVNNFISIRKCFFILYFLFGE